jgi:hypothetical protein
MATFVCTGKARAVRVTLTDFGETAKSLGDPVTVTDDGPNAEPVNVTFTDKGSPGPKTTEDGDTPTDESLEDKTTVIDDAGATETPTTIVA